MTSPATRVDASMTLLREVMERPLDPGYAEAAANPHPRGRTGTVLTVLLAVLAGWVFTVAVQGVRGPRPETARATEVVRTRIEQRTAVVGAQERRNAELRDEVARRQAAALAGAGGSALLQQVRTLGVLTGELPARGEGIRIQVDDAPGSRSDDDAGDPRADAEQSAGIVLDTDLQVIVNGLWAAGAEAVAVNGQRLTALSAIRSAGEAILVDFRPLSPPYVVEAIGDSSDLQTGFAAGSSGPYVQSLRDNNRIGVDISGRRDLRLPGSGQLVLRAARPPGATDGKDGETTGTAGTAGTTGTTGSAGTEAAPAAGSPGAAGPGAAGPGAGDKEVDR